MATSSTSAVKPNGVSNSSAPASQAALEASSIKPKAEPSPAPAPAAASAPKATAASSALVLDETHPWDAARIADALRQLHALQDQITSLRISAPGLLAPLTGSALSASSTPLPPPATQTRTPTPTPPPSHSSLRPDPDALAESLEAVARGVSAEVAALRAGWEAPTFKRSLERAAERADVDLSAEANGVGWDVMRGTNSWQWLGLDIGLDGLDLGSEGVDGGTDGDVKMAEGDAGGGKVK